MITVLADQNHYQLQRYLHPSIRLDTYDPIAGWTDAQIRNADAVLVRTTTPLNRNTLPSDSNVRFAGTASAGRDHLDEAFLNERGIHIADAKGSNARSVAEYVAVAVLSYCRTINAGTGSGGNTTPEELTAGIVGAGYTGSATAKILESLGIRCLLHDPPRAETDPGFSSESMDNVLSCDIISFHVPLEQNGRYATWHWFDEKKIRSHPKLLVINASRGGVVDEHALRNAVDNGQITGYILDVWEQEPEFDDDSVRDAFLATPHIAGYSIEAKRKASMMMCHQLHDYFGLPEVRPPDTEPSEVSIPEENRTLAEVLKHLHPAFSYDQALRSLIGLPPEKKGPAFLKLRQETPLRNEFSETAVPQSIIDRHPELRRLGVQARDSS